MGNHKRKRCKRCSENVRVSQFPEPPKTTIPRSWCTPCVEEAGWPDEAPMHLRPLEDRLADPDVARFYAELERNRKRRAEREVPHVRTKGNFRAFYCGSEA